MPSCGGGAIELCFGDREWVEQVLGLVAVVGVDGGVVVERVEGLEGMAAALLQGLDEPR